MINYVSLHDSTVMRKFEFHEDRYRSRRSGLLLHTFPLHVCASRSLRACRITGISMNPLNDTFISTSADGAMALWDMRMERPLVRNVSVRVYITVVARLMVTATPFPCCRVTPDDKPNRDDIGWHLQHV